MRPIHEPRVGDVAPDFCLPAAQATDGGWEKTEICLRDFFGKQPVILTFYGAAFTPV